MEALASIVTHRTNRSRLNEVDFNHLEFGKYIADHMLVCDHKDGAWQTPAIMPFGDLALSPTTLGLHYGQAIFEGLKAFRLKNGRVSIFRPQKHYQRLLRTVERMAMPSMTEEMFVEGLRELIRVDEAWVPRNIPGAGLYIRPFMFASEAKFGVKISDEYKYIVFSGPVAPAFARAIRVKVETDYVRAARGGTGSAKCAGNYGGAFYPTQKAREAGYDQVLWTDAKEHRFIEESGMMNAMFVIGGTLVTPPLSDSILDGITRDSLLQVARYLGIPTEERPVSIDELEASFRNNTLTEAFGAGTAAVVAPIDTIHIKGKDHRLPAYNSNSIMFRLRDKLEAMRTGVEEDIFGWNDVIE